MKDENTTGVLPTGTENGRLAGRPKKPRGWAGCYTPRFMRVFVILPAAARSNKSSGQETISIELSKAQVDQIVRSAGQGGTMSVLLSALKDPNWTLALDSDEWAYPAQMEDRRLSRSLLSGLLVLSCFPADGGYLGIAELARTLGMNTSTTHRYVTTLLAVGLLERDPATRRYRLAAP